MQIESDLGCTSRVHIVTIHVILFGFLNLHFMHINTFLKILCSFFISLLLFLGYSGSTCEVVANACLKNPCPDTARCQSMVTDFICMCPMGRQIVGRFCRKCL